MNSPVAVVFRCLLLLMHNNNGRYYYYYYLLLPPRQSARRFSCRRVLRPFLSLLLITVI